MKEKNQEYIANALGNTKTAKQKHPPPISYNSMATDHKEFTMKQQSSRYSSYVPSEPSKKSSLSGCGARVQPSTGKNNMKENCIQNANYAKHYAGAKPFGDKGNNGDIGTAKDTANAVGGEKRINFEGEN